MLVRLGSMEACVWEPVMYGVIMLSDQRTLCTVHLTQAVRTPAEGEALNGPGGNRRSFKVFHRDEIYT